MADRGIRDECDDETNGREYYFYEMMSIEEEYGYDAVQKLLSKEVEYRNKNDNTKSQERRIRGIGRRQEICYLDPILPPRNKSAAFKKDMQILHSLFRSNEAKEMDVGNDGGNMMNGTIIRALNERKLLWSSLDVAGSRVVAERPIKVPLIGEGSARYELDTGEPLHSVQVSVNRWDVYVKVWKIGLRPPPPHQCYEGGVAHYRFNN